MRGHLISEGRTMDYTVRCPKCKVWWDVGESFIRTHFPQVVRMNYGHRRNR